MIAVMRCMIPSKLSRYIAGLLRQRQALIVVLLQTRSALVILIKSPVMVSHLSDLRLSKKQRFSPTCTDCYMTGIFQSRRRGQVFSILVDSFFLFLSSSNGNEKH